MYRNISKTFNCHDKNFHLTYVVASFLHMSLMYKSQRGYITFMLIFIGKHVKHAKNRSCSLSLTLCSLEPRACDRLNQVAKRHSVPLGLNADRLHQHPHVLSGVAMDARRLPTFLPARPSAGQSGTARRERTPLHDVSKVKTRVKTKRRFERRPAD